MEIESPDNISLGLKESLTVSTPSTLQILLLYFVLLNNFGGNDLYSYHNTIIAFKFSLYFHLKGKLELKRYTEKTRT
jgi:hypothetical protein